MRRPNSPEKSGFEFGHQTIVITHVFYLVPLAGVRSRGGGLLRLCYRFTASTPSTVASVIGIETTGTNGDRISEIGAVKVRNHEVVALRETSLGLESTPRFVRQCSAHLRGSGSWRDQERLRIGLRWRAGSRLGKKTGGQPGWWNEFTAQ
ncbi:hypothetical protein ACVWZM_001886 [Bradyrhizobium sp. USDA 4501]